MTAVLKRYMPDGSTRSIWDDAVGDRERRAGVIPQRASRIEVVLEGPSRGLFCVDFSLLADATGKEEYRVCLAQTFKSYSEANRAEVEWLKQNFILEGLNPC